MNSLHSASGDLTHDNSVLVRAFEGKFAHESNLGYGTPSGNYYWFRKRKEVVKIIISHISELRRSPFVADIGCGDGKDLFLIRSVYEDAGISGHFIGLDGDPINIRVCELRRDYHKANNVEFLTGDISNNLPISYNSVGLVFCSEVLEHLINPEILIKEIHRVLKPNGYFLMTTPNEPNMLQRSFWSSKACSGLERTVEGLIDNPLKTQDATGKQVLLYGHISCKPNKIWDYTVERVGFELCDFGRGALFYGSTIVHDNPFLFGLRLIAEGMLDLLPKKFTRNISGQVLAFYRRK